MSETENPIPWVMPDWMEQYRDMIAGTEMDSIEDIVNDLSPNNIVRKIRISGQINLLYRLHNEGKLHAI